MDQQELYDLALELKNKGTLDLTCLLIEGKFEGIPCDAQRLQQLQQLILSAFQSPECDSGQ